ncbi:MAG: sigma-70 family RNA polymerase sigma factor [Chloroherpetonaceae bacterium]
MILVIKHKGNKKQAESKAAAKSKSVAIGKKDSEKDSTEMDVKPSSKTKTAKKSSQVTANAAKDVERVREQASKPVKASLKAQSEEEVDYEKIEAFSDEELSAAEQNSKEKPTTKLTRSEIERQMDFKNEAMIHIDALYNYAVRMTGDPEDANDLVQETYMKAYRFFDSFEKGTNCKAWLFRILKNSYINRYRKESKEPDKVDYDEIKEFYHTVKHSSLDSNDMQEKWYGDLLDDEISRALDSLPEDFREVVQLCDIEGFTYEEIANMVDCPIGTVRSRLHRGRKILREKLLDYARYHGYKPNPDEWDD